MTSIVLGVRVRLTIPGEEIGWDEDRGRPETVTPDEKIIGRVSKIGRQQPHGDRQIRISYEDADGDIRDAWGWLSLAEYVGR